MLEVPDGFAATYQPQADAVAAGTGIDPLVLLAQWGVETAWGQAIDNENNLANIRCIAGAPCLDGFAQFGSLDAFVQAAIATWHNGFYSDVLAASGAAAQLAAIGASPWDAGHYDNGGGPGSSLVEAFALIARGDPAMLIKDSRGATWFVAGVFGPKRPVMNSAEEQAYQAALAAVGADSTVRTNIDQFVVDQMDDDRGSASPRFEDATLAGEQQIEADVQAVEQRVDALPVAGGETSGAAPVGQDVNPAGAAPAQPDKEVNP